MSTYDHCLKSAFPQSLSALNILEHGAISGNLQVDMVEQVLAERIRIANAALGVNLRNGKWNFYFLFIYFWVCSRCLYLKSRQGFIYMYLNVSKVFKWSALVLGPFFVKWQLSEGSNKPKFDSWTICWCEILNCRYCSCKFI